MKWLVRLVLGLVTLTVLVTGAAFVYLRQSLPQLEGQVTLVGLGAPVDIQRDRYGIPHIYASTIEEAVFSLG